MVRIVLLCVVLASPGIADKEVQSTPPPNVGSVQSDGSPSADFAESNQITRGTDLHAGSSETPVAYKVQGRLIWRTKTGCIRVQFGERTKAFRLQGDTSELEGCNIGDLVEVRGNDVPLSTMRATGVRLVKAWDGTKLHCGRAFQDNVKMLWRYVEHTAVVREVLQTGNSCRLLIGSKVIVTTDAKMSDEQLATLLGSRIRVRGTSFQHPIEQNRNSPDYLYIGVLDPDSQIEMVKPRAIELATSAALVLERQTIDYVTQRYIALSGFGISSAMSQHLQPGDVVNVEASDLNSQNRTAKAIWLKKTGRAEPSSPHHISGNQILDNKHLHQRVAVQGIMEHCFATDHGLELRLSDNQRTYLVNVPLPDERRQVDQYARGALVSVTGVVRSISAGSDKTIKLFVASKEDLTIAETRMQLHTWLVNTVLAAVVASALLLALYYWALKRQVRRKTAELSTSTSQMIAASSAVRDGLLIFDANSRVRFVSEKIYSTLGISIPVGDSECNTRLRLQNLVYDTDVFANSWNDVFRNPLNTFEREFSLRESSRRVFAYSAPVYDEKGRPDGRIWTFEDITQRRRLEDETLRTRKLGAIGRLAGGVAHDFNNLLQVIGSNLELMRYVDIEDWDKSEETPLDTATSAIQRGADLTQQLLTFAKTSRVQIAPTDVNELLERTSSMLNRTLGNHIRLSVALSTDLPLAEIDSGQLEQVVINMCLNSREAIGLHDGYIRIATKSTEHEQMGSCIQILIEDDGCGMPPEVLSHVFEPFFTTKDIDKGTGLGLATAFGAIEQMQGRIECSSAPGEGTSFKIFLPGSESVACLPVRTSTPQIDKIKPRRILVVDDDARVLGSVNQLLISMGHDVICAAGGAEAMSTLKNELVDLVILDLSMPEMTGWQVLQQIREKHSELKVIVCSGYSDDATKMVASDIEPDAFLNKPFQLQQLSIVLESISD